MDWILELVLTLFIAVLTNGGAWVGVLFSLAVLYEEALPSKTVCAVLLSIGIVFFFGSWVCIADCFSVEAGLTQGLFILFIVVCSLVILCWIAYSAWKIIERYRKKKNN